VLAVSRGLAGEIGIIPLARAIPHKFNRRLLEIERVDAYLFANQRQQFGPNADLPDLSERASRLKLRAFAHLNILDADAEWEKAERHVTQRDRPVQLLLQFGLDGPAKLIYIDRREENCDSAHQKNNGDPNSDQDFPHKRISSLAQTAVAGVRM
jgi:hypothetical protein